MKEGKRQKQIGQLVQQELGNVFQHLSLSMINGALISISHVRMTPDLLEARVYISIFKGEDDEVVLEKIKEKHSAIKRELGNNLRHQLRRIPVLAFYLDDTLDYVFKMEEVFKKIDEDKQKG
ncbi:MAG TPA: 30S ribosome-binding factor RbfA [Chitinophagaceae bacterium]|nr:30S ribosome-binding factor RbfA [Chitinophagaceae bacterium]